MMRALIWALAMFVMVASGPVAQAQQTLEIPEAEFESVEGYKPVPLPDPSGGPVNQMFEYMELDMTGTLPEAVLESMLGETPYDFVEVVWGIEVSGDWGARLSGTGSLQVTDFTAGRGATLRIDPERYTGQHGFWMYNARLQTDGEHVFTLSAAFPPEQGGEALGTELEAPKAVFEVTWLCHMFEPDRTGCTDGSEEYFETELPILSKLHLTRRAEAYRIEFAARVWESRTHRDRGYSSSDLTGRIGDVRGWVCDAESWEADPSNCLSDDPLEVVDVTPEHERENVNFERPSVEWEFTTPVDLASLRRGFTLTTRDRAGNDIDVSGEIASKGGNRFAFSPDTDLESGVRYEARLKGGADGIRGRDGETTLGADHWWRFSTILDLEFQNNSDDPPLEMHIFQTVRDAPLVTDKPTAIRIYPNWEEHGHIHSDWQPTSFPITLDLNVVSENQRRVEPQFGGTATTEEIRLHRPDQFNAQHRRQAAHTINVYGWLPARGGGSPTVVEARLAAYDPFPEPLDPADVIVERDFEVWQTDPQPLTLRFAFLTVGPWADGVPSEDWLIGEQVARAAAEFTRQLLPVREVRTAFTNVEDARPGSGVSPVKELLADLRNSPHIVSQPQDVFVVLVPFDALDYSGGAVHTRFTDEADRGITLSIATSVDGIRIPISHQAESLVHEIGHYHGLKHKPGDIDDLTEMGLTADGYADPTIEGFRIAADGMTGQNKSYSEGNSEYPGSPTPLMWPSPLSSERVWINETEYRSLMNHLSR